MIPQETVEHIRNAANIVDVVGDYVSLHKAGANYKGLCPFHNERTPSFVVSEAKNYFKCFGCQEGGDSIRFLMKLNNMSYREALIHLANKYHIEIVETDLTDEDRAKQQMRQTFLTLCDFVCKHYEDNLDSEEGQSIAKPYLMKFGLNEMTLKKYRIGFAGASSTDLIDAVKKNGSNVSYLKDLGLTEEIDGTFADVITNSIVFPVFNKTGKVMAFAWHKLGESTHTINVLPRSAVFNPAETFYGMFQAGQSISRAKSCYIVGSPFDVIMMHHAGFENAVCAMDSIGRYCINSLSKMVSDDSVTVISSYDSEDDLNKCFSLIDALLLQGINVLGVDISGEGCVTDILTKKSSSEFEKQIKSNRKDCITFKVTRLLENAGGDNTKRTKAIQSALRSIKTMDSESAKQIYLNLLSRITNFPVNILSQEMSRLRVADTRQ